MVNDFFGCQARIGNLLFHLLNLFRQILSLQAKTFQNQSLSPHARQFRWLISHR